VPVQHNRLVIASRTMLTMLVVAAVVVLALGVASLVLIAPPETSGWLRSVFGRVFGVVALGLAAVLGVPSGIGLWAMAGARAEGVVPALSERVRLVLGAVAIGTVVATAVVLLVTGSVVAMLNLGLLALVALATLGLAGAVSLSPHRGRAIASAIALLLFAAGTVWVLRVFLAAPAPTNP
jgi:hypothetical protein